MSKHTPGPWQARKPESSNGWWDIGPKTRLSVATCYDKLKHHEDETEANARLIAAAPELLEALKDITEAGAEAWGEIRPMIRYAREVIEKAEVKQ